MKKELSYKRQVALLKEINGNDLDCNGLKNEPNITLGTRLRMTKISKAISDSYQTFEEVRKEKIKEIYPDGLSREKTKELSNQKDETFLKMLEDITKCEEEICNVEFEALPFEIVAGIISRYDYSSLCADVCEETPSFIKRDIKIKLEDITPCLRELVGFNWRKLTGELNVCNGLSKEKLTIELKMALLDINKAFTAELVAHSDKSFEKKKEMFSDKIEKNATKEDLIKVLIEKGVSEEDVEKEYEAKNTEFVEWDKEAKGKWLTVSIPTIPFSAVSEISTDYDYTFLLEKICII